MGLVLEARQRLATPFGCVEKWERGQGNIETGLGRRVQVAELTGDKVPFGGGRKGSSTLVV